MNQAQQTASAPSIDDLRAQFTAMLDAADPSVAIASIVLFQVDPAKESRFLANANTLTVATRRLRGCNVFAFHRAMDKSQGLQYLIYEDWETLELFKVQWNSQHLKTFQYGVGELIVAAPDLRFYYGWREYRDFGGVGELAGSLLAMPMQMTVTGAQMMARMFDPTAWIKAFSGALQQGAQPCGDCGKHAGASPPAQAAPAPARPSSPAPPAPQQGWGPMPGAASTPTAVAAPAPAPAPPPAPIAEPNISPDYPYAPNYVEVHGSRMHFITQGTGDPILLLHGNPTWSYLWRNIIPHLSPLGRCIAPDLIGYGLSDKPDIAYSWFDHVHYLEGFMHRLGLENVTLVLHDHGSGLGFHYAMRHPRNVKAIAFFEAIVRPFAWDEFSTPPFREIFRQFRTGDIGGEGWQMIVDRNMFIEQLLPEAAGRPLSEKEMNYYRKPFRELISRMPIWKLARETPIGGTPQDVWDAVGDYSRKLGVSEIPKLMLYATPGALLTPLNVDWVMQNYANLTSVDLGPGVHFLQESSPHRIGREIASWLRNLRNR